MHYANGREAKVGDLVRGKGYNLKHEFTGILLTAQPENSACNCTVATVTEKSLFLMGCYNGPNSFREAVEKGWALPMRVEATLEYGQLDAFVAIDPENGDVLEPEESNV